MPGAGLLAEAAAGDGEHAGERVVQLVGDAGGELAHRGQLLGAEQLALRHTELLGAGLDPGLELLVEGQVRLLDQKPAVDSLEVGAMEVLAGPFAALEQAQVLLRREVLLRIVIGARGGALRRGIGYVFCAVGLIASFWVALNRDELVDQVRSIRLNNLRIEQLDSEDDGADDDEDDEVAGLDYIWEPGQAELWYQAK